MKAIACAVSMARGEWLAFLKINNWEIAWKFVPALEKKKPAERDAGRVVSIKNLERLNSYDGAGG
jgi:hypothetical protein